MPRLPCWFEVADALHVAVLVGFLCHLELADASADKEYHGDTAKPPCQRDTRCKTGDYEENAANCIADDV